MQFKSEPNLQEAERNEGREDAQADDGDLVLQLPAA